MKQIPLTKGKVALVDDDMYDYLMQWKWHTLKGRDTYYAKRDGWLMHRAITKAPEGMEVDHINGNGLDNRKENLRVCTRSENQRNKTGKRKSKTGYKGVVVNKEGRFQAQICGKYLGTYSAPADAARAYDEAAKKLFGEFARLNFEG